MRGQKKVYYKWAHKEGRGKETKSKFKDSVKGDMRVVGKREDAEDRVKWKRVIH